LDARLHIDPYPTLLSLEAMREMKRNSASNSRLLAFEQVEGEVIQRTVDAYFLPKAFVSNNIDHSERKVLQGGWHGISAPL